MFMNLASDPKKIQMKGRREKWIYTKNTFFKILKSNLWLVAKKEPTSKASLSNTPCPSTQVCQDCMTPYP